MGMDITMLNDISQTQTNTSCFHSVEFGFVGGVLFLEHRGRKRNHGKEEMFGKLAKRK